MKHAGRVTAWEPHRMGISIVFNIAEHLWFKGDGTTPYSHDLKIYGFTSRSRIGDVTIAGEGLQNLGLCSAFRAFEHGEIFIVPHLLRHEASVFPDLSERPPQSVAFYNTQGDVEDQF
jgi:hypothetical protein